MIYVTWGDSFSGIFKSQVVDVLKYLQKIGGDNIKLISFVPYVRYKEQKKIISSHYQNSIIIPMIPSRNHWVLLWSIILIPILLFNRGKAIGRGTNSVKLLLLMRKIGLVKKVIYDGRGAIYAEYKEYMSKLFKVDLDRIKKIEKQAVLKSDFRIAVTSELVKYWKQEYNYNENKHVVIPTLIGEDLPKVTFDKERITEVRKKYQFNYDDIIFVFSGGSDLWQSKHLIDSLFESVKSNERIKFLFLSKIELSSIKSFKGNESRFKKDWVSPNEVYDILSACDYGVLLREDTITNKVASPTKFPEYLYSGLKVIISSNIGDYSDMIKNYPELGIVLSDNKEEYFRLSINDRKIITAFSDKLVKSEYEKMYQRVLSI